MLMRKIIYGNLLKFCAPAAYTSAYASRITVTRNYHEITGNTICPPMVKGLYWISNPRLNKGLAFTLEERQTLGIHGLIPPAFSSQEEQMQMLKAGIDRYEDPLNKYIYLIDLQDRNEHLFYSFITANIDELMPIVYTPTVGLACQRFGLIYRRPRGLFITIHDKGHILKVLKNWPEPTVRAIVVTDGERILGLGDLGANGMGICVGKLALYTALAGVRPHNCLPIMLDVGTNNQEMLNDPMYLGIRQKRTRGEEYFEFMDEFMQAVVSRYGRNTLIQFEDFGNQNAFQLLDRYRNSYCTFNDDIQGTAAVTLGGLIASERMTGIKICDHTFLFVGAGEAACGIADLLLGAIMADGASREAALRHIWMVDVDGLLTTTRKDGNLDGIKRTFAKNHKPMKNLEEMVDEFKPSVLIGATAAAGIFTTKILQTMAKNNKRPIIFALSNPTSKAECTAEQAYQHTEGRVIFSSGSPFPPVTINNTTFHSGQGNNAYIFPGIALGIICTGTYIVSQEIFLIAAKELANSVEDADLKRGSLYPPLKKIKEVSFRIAIAVTQNAYDKGLASFFPEPLDKDKWLEERLYDTNYRTSMAHTYKWPQMSEMKPKAEPKSDGSDSGKKSDKTDSDKKSKVLPTVPVSAVPAEIAKAAAQDVATKVAAPATEPKPAAAAEAPKVDTAVVPPKTDAKNPAPKDPKTPKS